MDPRGRQRGQGRRAGSRVPGRAGPRARAAAAERDFDLGRGWGLLPSGGPAAPVTAVLVTPGDNEEDWLHAGQALQRLLLRAASQWVFAGLQTQPLQVPVDPGADPGSLALPGPPQMLLQLGVARATHPTGRRPAAELGGPPTGDPEGPRSAAGR